MPVHVELLMMMGDLGALGQFVVGGPVGLTFDAGHHEANIVHATTIGIEPGPG
jgi:hypothetical protein